MIRNNVNWTIKNLKNMVDNPNKDTLNFEHPIQRRGDVWKISEASLLIHSILMNSLYPIPAIYCLKEMNEKGKYTYSILDGKQRLSNIFKFINNEFALADVPNAILDGVEYELENQYFSDLSAECQMEILRYKFTIYSFEPEEEDDDEFVNEVIEDIFFRLNSSVALSITDKSRALMGVAAINFLNKILKSKLFQECSKFSSLQIKKSDDLNTLLQSCILLENKYNGYEYKNLSQKETSKYSEYLHSNFTEEMQQKLLSICEYLEKAFPEQDKMLKKINIPIVFMVADVAIGDYNPNNKKSSYRVGPAYFRQWFSYFFNECYEEYSQYCSSGSTRLDKVQGRINTMLGSFNTYFEIEISEPEKEIQEEQETTEEQTEQKTEPLMIEESSKAEKTEEGFASDIEENKPPADETIPADDEPITEPEQESQPNI